MGAKQALKYTAVLIGIYLLVVNYTGSGSVIKAGTDGAGNLITALQGR